jgi:hypothetical protein
MPPPPTNGKVLPPLAQHDRGDGEGSPLPSGGLARRDRDGPRQVVCVPAAARPVGGAVGARVEEHHAGVRP